MGGGGGGGCNHTCVQCSLCLHSYGEGRRQNLLSTVMLVMVLVMMVMILVAVLQ